MDVKRLATLGMIAVVCGVIGVGLFGPLARVMSEERVTQKPRQGHNEVEATRRTLALGLRQHLDMIQAISGLALWGRYRTARDMTKYQKMQEQFKQEFPQVIFQKRQSSRGACAYRFVCNRYKWRYEVRALMTGAGNVFDFEGPYDTGEVWMKRVFKVSVCDGSDIFTYDATSNRVVIEQLDEDRPLFLRFPLRDYLLLGYGPLDYGKIEDTTLLATKETDMVGDYECYVLYGYPPWAAQQEPREKGEFRLWICPALGFAAVKAEVVAWHGERAKRNVWVAHDFAEIASGLWVPKETVRYILDYSPGEQPLLLTSVMRFYDIQVPDLPVNGQLPFHLSIPLGTPVYDRRQGKQYHDGVTGIQSDFEKGCPPLPEEYLKAPVPGQW